MLNAPVYSYVMVEGHYIAGSDDALNYHEDNTMLAQNPASGNMIESPVYTYGRNSFLWNGDEYVSCIDQPFNSHKDNQSHLNAYKEKKTPLDSLQKKKTMSKVPMFPSVGFGDHYVPGIGHPILGMSYPSFYKHYNRDTGDLVKPSEEKMTFEVYPPFGDHFIECIDQPLNSDEDHPVVVEQEVDPVVETSDIDADNNVENDLSVVEKSGIDMDKIDETKPSVNTADKTDATNSKREPCSLCEKTFKFKKNLKYHQEHHHADQDSASVIAMKQRETVASAKRKLKDKKQIKCGGCTQTFPTNQQLEVHNMWTHGDPNDPKIIAFKREKNEKRRQYR